MDTDGAQTWIIGDIERYRNDYFFTKNSTPEATDDGGRLGAAPAPNKSRAALILTEVEEQLEMNETEYNTMKDRFDYMKMLYLGAESIPSQIGESKPADKFTITETSSPRDIVTPNSPVDDEKSSDGHLTSEGTQYYDFYTETQQNKRQHDDEPTEQSPQYSARLYKGSPGRNVYLGVGDGNSSDSGPQHYFSEEAGSERKTYFPEELSENAGDDDEIQIRREQKFGDTSTSPQHPYQLHLAEYSKSIHEEMEDDSREAEQEAEDPQPPQQDEEICFEDFPRSARNQEETKQEIFLNLSGSAESVQTTKKKKSRSEKQRRVVSSATSTNKKNSVKQVDETLCGASRIRRKKLRRVKASNSRSTTATTRDTCFSTENKKDTRKQKQRGNSTMPASQSSQHRPEIASKIQQNWSEVVEIYHNSALQSGSLSVVSSKHSRLEPRGRNAVSANPYDRRSATKEPHQFTESNDQTTRNFKETEFRRSLKSPKNCQRIDGEENRTESKIYHPALQDAADPRSGEPNGTKLIYKAKGPSIPSDNKIPEDCNDVQLHHRNPESPEHSSACYDPLTVRSYELPTVASKMKRVNRSYFNRFNFRNIPFVVGTSVTPSYNLGLNIQETLSLIKTRQTMPGGVTPLLISKVSKGVQPVSTLLGCVGDQEEMPEESDIRFDVPSARLYNYYPEQMVAGCRPTKTAAQVGPFSPQPPRLTCVPTTIVETPKTIDVPSAKKRKSQSVCSSMKLSSRKNAEVNLQLTPSALLRQRQEELNIGDSQSTKWQGVPQNMNGIREVLVNFHDQFEAMNSKYEKLQEQAEASNDESLKKELATLEKELTAKEEEINAVVNLYKEVMALKQQMRLLHERNSLVCVTTESPGSPMYPQLSSRAQTANPMFSHYRRGALGNNQGPSTSTRLAGLLRQIKVFQKQLKSAT